MKNKFCLLLLLVTGLGAAAQKREIRFSSMLQAGLLEGERGNAFQLKSINGVRYKTWATGIGVGLDYYHTRSIPLFLDVRKTFGGREKAPFAYASGGYHFPWLKAAEKEGSGLEAKGGLYFDAGVGYQLPVKKSDLFFTIGYSQKSFSETQTYPVWITIWPYPSPNNTKYEYTLRRLSIGAGIRF